MNKWLAEMAHAAIWLALVVCKNSRGSTHSLLLSRADNIPNSLSGSPDELAAFKKSKVELLTGPPVISMALHFTHFWWPSSSKINYRILSNIVRDYLMCNSF
jgi:hypothetical protein